MIIIEPSISHLDGTQDPLKIIERAGRACYQSEIGSSEGFVVRLISRGHFSVIEHAYLSYRIICDRGVSHELVRHRLFSFSQESTRYCKYKGQLTFVRPHWYNRSPETIQRNENRAAWLNAMHNAEDTYLRMLNKGLPPQDARAVLPNSLKTELIMTGNLRNWRHFFELRCSPAAHPDMRIIANLLLADAKDRVKIVFDGIGKDK